MTEHIRRTGRFYLLIAAVIFAVPLINAWSAALGFMLLVFGTHILLATLLIGSLIFLVRGIMLARTADLLRRERAVLALMAPAMLGATILLALPMMAAGAFTGSWTRLMVHRNHYEAIIEKARLGIRQPRQGSAFEEDGGVSYVVDQGPPLRVAFNPEGILDNWSGIVFDPTHQVMLADGFDASGRFVAPERITKLFGGDLVGCRHLYGDFFHCSFT